MDVVLLDTGTTTTCVSICRTGNGELFVVVLLCFIFYPQFVVLRSFVLSNNIYVHSNTFSVVVVEEFDWSIRSIVTVAVSPI